MKKMNKQKLFMMQEPKQIFLMHIDPVASLQEVETMGSIQKQERERLFIKKLLLNFLINACCLNINLQWWWAV